MNSVSYAVASPESDVDALTAGDHPQIEVALAWGDTILETKHLPLGTSLSVGEALGCDLLIPYEVLGVTRAVIVADDAGRVVVTPPARSITTFDGALCERPLIALEEGHVAIVRIGAFAIRVAVVREARRIPVPFVESLKEAGLGGISLSTLVHASLFAAFALFMPALGQTDDEDIARDQLLTMQHLINASAMAEPEAVLTESESGDTSTGEASPSGGGLAAGASGSMGTQSAHELRARWSAAGDAKPSDATLSREQKIAMVKDFGMLGLLASAIVSDPNAPVVPWGSSLNGSDRGSHLGNLWGGDPADAFGIGGLGFSGSEEGGGGTNIIGVGLNDIGGLGHSLDTRLGSGDPGGFGCKAGARCTGRVSGEHHPTAGLRMPREIKTNGRIPSEVIQRIVRQNAGRFRLCYEAGLRGNPSLEGRVAVRFVIDRNGAVSIAQDGDSDLPDSGVRKCVVQSFFNLSFPAPDNGTVTVTYPIAFTPGG